MATAAWSGFRFVALHSEAGAKLLLAGVSTLALAICHYPAAAQSADDWAVPDTLPVGRIHIAERTADTAAGAAYALAQPLLFWDGDDPDLHGNAATDGGSGVWTAELGPLNSSWTDQAGAFNGGYSPNPAFAVFQGAAGAVTVDDSEGTVRVTGIQVRGGRISHPGGSAWPSGGEWLDCNQRG